MANPEHLTILSRGIAHWNGWRQRAGNDRPDLSAVDLSKADLSRGDLSSADLSRANLSEALLVETDLSGANLREALLTYADLESASLRDADLSNANLSNCKLKHGDLRGARLVRADFRFSDITGSRVFGIAAWNVLLDGAIQRDLIITPPDEPIITTDSLEIAQFMYLLLNSPKVRNVVDALSTKVVLVLGRFTPDRKSVADALMNALRQTGYVPVLLSVDQPSSRDFVETISTLAHLSIFVIADLTDSTIAQALSVIVPSLSIPVQPLVGGATPEYSMFSEFRRYPWVLPVFRYRVGDDLTHDLVDGIVRPAERKAMELQRIRSKAITEVHES